MKTTILAAVIATVGLAGCATNNDYRLYAETQQRIAQAQAQAHATAETARYAALAEIAKNGDATSRVAAAMSLSLSNGQAAGQSIMKPMPVNPPVSFSDKALQWTSVLLPGVTSLYGINANRQVAITQSNNQAAVAQSTNATFATMNSNMATSNTAIANAGFTAVTNVANTGIAQVGATAAAGLTAVTNVNANSNTAITNVANAANSSIKAVADIIPLLQPNVTTTTTNNN